MQTPQVISPFLGLLLLAVLVLLFAFWMKRKRTPVAARQLADTPAYEVLCIDGPLRGRRYRFERPWLLIGRQPGCDIVLQGPLISRRHAFLSANQNALVLKDLDSTNGTWFGKQRVNEIVLAAKQPFQIGAYSFVVVGIGQNTPSPVPSAIQYQENPITSMAIRDVYLADYDRVSEIGKGGAATVYLYRHRQAGSRVAVKILHDSADPYFKQKFKYEGQIGQYLQHPHIVKTFGYGEWQNVSYILMEYLPQGSLREVMNRGSLTLAQCIQIVGQICLALEYAHQQKVYHRDIKPENILFAENGVAKLADFGIARLTGMKTLTQAGMLIGTPEYMSYEQAKGAEIDGRSDQYSLGIVLYEILTGQRPFTGEALTIVGKHLSEKPLPPRKINPNIPRNIERVILKALEKNKNARYRDMITMAQALGFQPDPGLVQAPVVSAVVPAKTPAGAARVVNLQTGMTINLSQVGTVLGRDNVGNPQVSRQHARIWLSGTNYVIEDLDSLNGTYVNGSPVKSAVSLTPGSYIHLGSAQLQFQVD
ncbi:MAG: protein kinase [Anaerolineales bacterium]|nr:protein kinase [Anaerolineales bacterium]